MFNKVACRQVAVGPAFPDRQHVLAAVGELVAGMIVSHGGRAVETIWAASLCFHAKMDMANCVRALLKSTCCGYCVDLSRLAFSQWTVTSEPPPAGVMHERATIRERLFSFSVNAVSASYPPCGRRRPDRGHRRDRMPLCSWRSQRILRATRRTGIVYTGIKCDTEKIDSAAVDFVACVLAGIRVRLSGFVRRSYESGNEWQRRRPGD